MLRRSGSDTGSELERIRLRNHVLILGLGSLTYGADTLVAWLGASGPSYAGDLALRLATISFAGVLLARLLTNGKPARVWEVSALLGLTLGSAIHTVLSVYADGLNASVLLGNGLWMYLLYAYVFSVLDGRRALLWNASTLVLMTLAIVPSWSASAPAERWAYLYYQAGAGMATALGWGLAGWRTAYAQAHRRVEEAEHESLTDSLTGQPNRRALRFTIAREIARARRTARPFALLLLDLDHFKNLNDTHGHAVGDAVLRELAAVVRGALREGDEFGRWGGEEFVVIAPGTDESEAVMLAGRLRLAMHRHEWPFTSVRASMGITVSNPGDTIEQLFDRADIALYRAKEGGRDRSEVVLAGREEIPAA